MWRRGWGDDGSQDIFIYVKKNKKLSIFSSRSPFLSYPFFSKIPFLVRLNVMLRVRKTTKICIKGTTTSVG